MTSPKKYSAKVSRVLNIFILITFVSLSLITYKNTPVFFQDNNKIVLNKNKEPEKTKYLVSRVIDGDSIEVIIDNEKEDVRLLGIDAPEMNDKKKIMVCFAHKSKNNLELKIKNKEVVLESDPSQADKDKYGRLLRYIYYNNELINKSILSQGDAVVYKYFIVNKMDEFREVEKVAKENKFGIWSGKCN
jgi:micrococcal nuclease